MDVILSRVTQQAVHYAIRSGISITTGYAIKEGARLLNQAPKSQDREELMRLQQRLESKIRIISPSIDMIELIAARGNTSLESAVSLSKDIRYGLQRLGQRLSHAANNEELLQQGSRKAKSREDINRELRACIDQIKLLLAQIEDAIPLINLAITTSGVNLSTKLSGTISPSRLLQASTFLTSADTKYTADATLRQQVGPTYTVTLYMLFAGHASRPQDEQGVRETTWKEVIHKAKVKLWRVPLDQLYDLPGGATTSDGLRASTTIPADAKAHEFAYQLSIVEDLDDGRYHDDEDENHRAGPFDDVAKAGIRDVVPVHEASKIFYADTGKILNIGADDDTFSPVLLLKRDVHAEPPRRMLHRTASRISLHGQVEIDDQSEIDAQIERESLPPTPRKQSEGSEPGDCTWRLPADLDPEWMAFEVYTEDDDAESEDDDTPPEPMPPSTNRATSLEPSLTSAMAHLKLCSNSSPSHNGRLALAQAPMLQLSPGRRAAPAIRTSLSLLEMLMKLAALQQFRQDSVLSIEDELLNFFLEDSATAGAGADKQYRQRVRQDATRRVGFDPYDESPVKRRGEEYIRAAADGGSPRGSPGGLRDELTYHDSYGLDEQPIPRLEYFATPSVEQTDRRLPSSPPQRPSSYRQTQSRTSTPGASEGRKDGARLECAEGQSSPLSQLLVTPPSSSGSNVKTRAGLLRMKSEQRQRSPLHEVTNDGGE